MPPDVAVPLKYRDQKGTPPKFFEPPDTLVPSQYCDLIQGCRPLTPTEKLMLAVLESAVHDFQRYRWATQRRGKRLFREVHAWLTSREETALFSYVAICHAIGIDSAYLRKGLLAWPPGQNDRGKAEGVSGQRAAPSCPHNSRQGEEDK